jgi:hypothetical protein
VVELQACWILLITQPAAPPIRYTGMPPVRNFLRTQSQNPRRFCYSEADW